VRDAGPERAQLIAAGLGLHGYFKQAEKVAALGLAVG
jgi:hypothetical protein